MMKQTGIPSRWWPIVVHSSFDCHWSTAFVTIKLEEPPVALGRRTINSHYSMERDFDRCIRLQLIKRAVLEQNKEKQVSLPINKYIT